MKLVFSLCSDCNKASSRVRGYWIAEALNEQGVQCSLRWREGKIELLYFAISILGYDVIIFQKTYSRYHRWLMQWAKLLGKSCYMDIDDAPSKINAPKTLKNFRDMLALADGVFAGSKNLVDYCKPYQPKTYLIPSSIYLKHYHVYEHESDKLCLGWIGNGKHYKQDLIEILLEPLKRVAADHPIRLKLVGVCGEPDIYEAFGEIEGLDVDFIDSIEWSNPNAVSQAMRDVDIGLYPLLPNDFNHFKCGFKALEYMAMGIPVVLSSVAINVDIISHGEDGYLTNGVDEWVDVLNGLIDDPEMRERMGKSGRTKVEGRYNVEKTAALIASIMFADMIQREEA